MRLYKLLIFCLIFYTSLCYALDYSGVYSFNKGINKANGYLYVFHFKPDSLFFYLSTVSGAPDFLMSNLKGFASIDSNNAVYVKNNCIIQFGIDAKKGISIKQNDTCVFEFSFNGIYKRNNQALKRNTTWMTEYSEKNAVIKLDSLILYNVPHYSSQNNVSLQKGTSVKVLDEYNGFYLIEINHKKTEFIWAPKKWVQLSK